MEDNEDAYMAEEVRQHQAASLIQRKWRDYSKEYLSPTVDNGENGDGEGGEDGAAEAELSEEALIEKSLEHCRSLLAEREGLLQVNSQHQRTLGRLFAERKSSQGLGQDGGVLDVAGGGAAANSADAEAKYWSTIQVLRDDRMAVEKKRQMLENEVRETIQRRRAFGEEAEQYDQNFREFVKEKARQARFSRNNKPIPEKVLEQYDADEAALYAAVQSERVQYIRLRNKARKLAADLSDREKKKEGMNLIDFEQLKIENTNLNEKIEERNEDLLKLRKKATTTIHVLTHVKEKLEYVKGENTGLLRHVSGLEEELGTLRERLAHAKSQRDVFSNDNIQMREKMPMIGSEDLLLDYEVRKKEIESCRIDVVNLTNKHHELMQWISAFQPKLETLQQSVL